MSIIEHELTQMRLTNIWKERNEIIRLKSSYNLFDINQFSLNKYDRGRYRRNIVIVKKLLKLIPRSFNLPFHIYIKNIKKERYKYKINIYLKKICGKNNIPDDIMLYIKNII
jgi:hypothetical protein